MSHEVGQLIIIHVSVDGGHKINPSYQPIKTPFLVSVLVDWVSLMRNNNLTCMHVCVNLVAYDNSL